MSIECVESISFHTGRTVMASFAENRNAMNKGCGESSGVWVFEEFMFADSVFGRAVVEYDAVAVRMKSEDREMRSLMSLPYEIQISAAKVKEIEVFNDDGDCCWRLSGVENLPIPTTSDNILRIRLVQDVLAAFRAVVDEVLNFEMGML